MKIASYTLKETVPSELPAGVFDGLTSLKYLYLANNELLDVSGVPQGLSTLGLSGQSREVSVPLGGTVTGLEVFNTAGTSPTGPVMGDGGLARWDGGVITWLDESSPIGSTDVIGLDAGLLGGAGGFTVTFNVTLVEAPAQNIQVSFDANGGSGQMEALEVEEGSELVAPESTFARAGFSFTGWNTDPEGTGVAYLVGDLVDTSASLVLYAQWSADPTPPTSVVTVTFNANGGSGIMPAVEGPAGSELTLPKNVFVRDGYKFTGWNTNADGTGTKIADGATMTLPEVRATQFSVDLYAQWEKTTPTPNDNGGKETKKQGLASTGANTSLILGMIALLGTAGTLALVSRKHRSRV